MTKINQADIKFSEFIEKTIELFMLYEEEVLDVNKEFFLDKNVDVIYNTLEMFNDINFTFYNQPLSKIHKSLINRILNKFRSIFRDSSDKGSQSNESSSVLNSNILNETINNSLISDAILSNLDPNIRKIFAQMIQTINDLKGKKEKI